MVSSMDCAEAICDLLVYCLAEGALRAEAGELGFETANTSTVAGLLAIAEAVDSRMDNVSLVPFDRGIKLLRSVTALLRLAKPNSRAVAAVMRLLKELVKDQRLARHFAMHGGLESLLAMQAFNWNDCLVGDASTIFQRICTEPAESCRSFRTAIIACIKKKQASMHSKIDEAAVQFRKLVSATAETGTVVDAAIRHVYNAGAASQGDPVSSSAPSVNDSGQAAMSDGESDTAAVKRDAANSSDALESKGEATSESKTEDASESKEEDASESKEEEPDGSQGRAVATSTSGIRSALATLAKSPNHPSRGSKRVRIA